MRRGNGATPNEKTRLLPPPGSSARRMRWDLRKKSSVNKARNDSTTTTSTADDTTSTSSLEQGPDPGHGCRKSSACASATSPAPQGGSRWTTRQMIILCILLVATLTSSFAVCLFPPFFPKIAEEKGCSATVYGFIIGTNCLTSFIVTPFIGKHLRIIGVRFALILGIFTGGVCCLLSGFLQFFKPGWEFVALAVLIRIVHATGNAAVITGTFTFTAIEFQDSVGRIFSLTRAAMNLAQMFGPLIGGAIYGAGGFYLPFVVMGSCQILMSFACIPILPECIFKSSGGSSQVEGPAITVCNIVSIPKIWFSFFTFIVATACNGFLSINLEPKVLRNFELSPLLVGTIFGMKDGANSIASPIWGYLCDKNRHRTVKPFIVGSAAIAAASFFLLGASDVFGIHLKLSIPLVMVALTINGIGIGGEQVAGIMDALHEAANAGYPNDPAMHGLVAGLWSSLSGVGRFVSRAGSGMLVDHFGFQKTAFVACTLQCVVASVTFLYMFFFEIRLKRNKSVRWDDVTIVEEGSADEVFFTESHSPSESVMSRSVHVSTRQAGIGSDHRGGGGVGPSAVTTAGPFGCRRALLQAGGSGSSSGSSSLPVSSRRILLHQPPLIPPHTPNLQEEVEAASAFRACSLK